VEHELGSGEQPSCLSREALPGVLEVLLIHLHPDTVPAAARGGEGRRPGAEERVEDGVPDEGEHADEPGRQLQRERRGMVSRGGAGEAGPNLLKPGLVVRFGDDAKDAGGEVRRAVPPRLPLHQEKLNVILDESVLYRTIGGHAAVLREQLQHLLYMSELPHITIRLAPVVFDGDMLHHIGGFQILFADKHQPLALYFDNGKNNGEPINDVALIEIWHQRLASFRRQTLNPHESRNAIRKALDSMYPPLS